MLSYVLVQSCYYICIAFGAYAKCYYLGKNKRDHTDAYIQSTAHHNDRIDKKITQFKTINIIYLENQWLFICFVIVVI